MYRFYEASQLSRLNRIIALDASGYRSLDYARELTLKFSDVRDDWVTELKEPIALK